MALPLDSIIAPTLGGILIGSAAALLLYAQGRIAGISGIIGGTFAASPGDKTWRGSFVLGLLAGGVLLLLLRPGAIAESPRSLSMTLIGGLLVGFGTRLGSGCTSGHGVCGIARLSPRSIVATLVFIALGMATVTFVGGV